MRAIWTTSQLGYCFVHCMSWPNADRSPEQVSTVEMRLSTTSCIKPLGNPGSLRWRERQYEVFFSYFPVTASTLSTGLCGLSTALPYVSRSQIRSRCQSCIQNMQPESTTPNRSPHVPVVWATSRGLGLPWLVPPQILASMIIAHGTSRNGQRPRAIVPGPEGTKARGRVELGNQKKEKKRTCNLQTF